MTTLLVPALRTTHFGSSAGPGEEMLIQYDSHGHHQSLPLPSLISKSFDSSGSFHKLFAHLPCISPRSFGKPKGVGTCELVDFGKQIGRAPWRPRPPFADLADQPWAKPMNCLLADWSLAFRSQHPALPSPLAPAETPFLPFLRRPISVAGVHFLRVAACFGFFSSCCVYNVGGCGGVRIPSSLPFAVGKVPGSGGDGGPSKGHGCQILGWHSGQMWTRCQSPSHLI
ncbi:hypothetical protein B0H65DRAFT_148721 [Neurospora tetraspora]|uniref:Uncharacterized protein n=1 Tax=Neurospora tetraspora TaxID=94610 RepID=A0AAE0MSR6_9PEZI|nr:hypothetical protein B0H65DRAFT_148721 [Neurospora tetraspora]